MSTHKTWMIYGATGFTGKLIAQEAVSRGFAPVLAGRNPEKTEELARQLGLSYVVFSLDNPDEVYRHILDVDLVCLAAGPFNRTSEQVVRACLKAGTHYVDITGEVDVFEKNFTFGPEAAKREIVIMSGTGFDVVPSDCLSLYASDQVSDPIQLEIAIGAQGALSPGTSKTMVEHFHQGVFVRKDGKLVHFPLGKGARQVTFLDHDRFVAPATWGDLSTAYHSTGIPNIITYLSYPKQILPFLRWVGPLMRNIFRVPPVKSFFEYLIDKKIHGPSQHMMDTVNSYVWVRVSNERGEEVQAWLECPEPYKLTAITTVLAIEEILKGQLKGVLTPAMAFGADFILKVPGVRRVDKQLNTKKATKKMKLVV